jgi:hypothetical protein
MTDNLTYSQKNSKDAIFVLNNNRYNSNTQVSNPFFNAQNNYKTIRGLSSIGSFSLSSGLIVALGLFTSAIAPSLLIFRNDYLYGDLINELNQYSNEFIANISKSTDSQDTSNNPEMSFILSFNKNGEATIGFKGIDPLLYNKEAVQFESHLGKKMDAEKVKTLIKDLVQKVDIYNFRIQSRDWFNSPNNVPFVPAPTGGPYYDPKSRRLFAIV